MTGELGLYNRDIDVATQMIIKARVADGDTTISTYYVMDTLGCVTGATKHAVRWGFRAAKNAGLIVKGDGVGVYNIIG